MIGEADIKIHVKVQIPDGESDPPLYFDKILDQRMSEIRVAYRYDDPIDIVDASVYVDDEQ